MDVFSNKFTVNFSDIDENNKLSNQGILRLMQEIAGQHSDSVGCGLNDTPKTGIAWIILNWKLKVFLRPKWNEKITIDTWTKCEKSLFCYRNFKLYDSSNNVVAIAISKWVLFDVNKNRVCKVPTEIQNAFPDSTESVFTEKFNEKLLEPENSNFIFNYTIQKRDIDTNHHVNNLNYLDYAIEALENCNISHTQFSNIEIMYKHEAKYKDSISVFYCKLSDNEHIITIKDEKMKNIHAIIKLYN